MSEYFPKPKSLGGKIKVKLDFSNYMTKAVLKDATGVDISNDWFSKLKIRKW